MTIPVRRGSITISTCDTELANIAQQLKLGHPDGEARTRLQDDADRWLDLRLELAEERKRIKRNSLA